MNPNECHCVFALPSEDEIVTLPGTRPGTAFRVRMQPGPDGYVRIEQLAFNANLGWYTQKSFCIPVEVLPAMITQLRKANCLVPHATRVKLSAHAITPTPLPTDHPDVERNSA